MQTTDRNGENLFLGDLNKLSLRKILILGTLCNEKGHRFTSESYDDAGNLRIERTGLSPNDNSKANQLNTYKKLYVLQALFLLVSDAKFSKFLRQEIPMGSIYLSPTFSIITAFSKKVGAHFSHLYRMA